MERRMAMNNPVPLTYNPREESPRVLEEMLVGRDDILEELRSDLLSQAKSATRQHWLIRGPRGIGKTHLIAILYHRIHGNTELSSSFQPVWLGEAEAYEAYSAGMLLLAVANRLAAELDRHGNRAAASAIRDAISQMPYGGDDPALFDSLSQLLKEEARSSGKILVVLMENLDAWLESIAGQRGTVEAGRLRSLLSEDKEFLFISTTPTRYLPKLSRPGSPLFGHLRERKLQPLSEENLRDLFIKLKALTGRAVDIEDDPRRPETRLRWRVLHRLAGGNPRAAVMGFSVISGVPGVRAMVEELVQLLDRQTAYFEARLARLAPRERAIVKAVAASPQTLTISEIAAATRLPERSLSTQVKRLLDEGHIAPAGDRAGKGSFFELTDGLFRTWLHYRSGHTLEPLVRFLAMWHTPVELESTLSALFAEAAAPLPLLERDFLELTATQIRSALDYVRSPAGAAERERLWKECELDVAGTFAPSDLSVRITETVQVGESVEGLRRTVADLRDSRDPATRERLAGAMIKLAVALRDTESIEEAIAALRELVNRFADAAEAAVQKHVARAMMGLGFMLGQSGRRDEAIKTYRDLSVRFANTSDTAVQQSVASAMSNLAVTLRESGRIEEEVAAHRDVISRFASSEDPAVQEAVSSNMFDLGLALGQSGRVEEEIKTYRDLIERFTRSEKPPVKETVARAMLNLGVRLGESGRVEEGCATWRDLINRFSQRPEPALQGQVLSATVNLAVSLGRSGQVEEEAATYRDLIARLSSTQEPAVQGPIATAMLNLGITVGQSGNVEEEIATYRDLIKRFSQSPEAAVQEQVASAMLNLGITVGQSGQVEEEIATYRDLITRFRQSPEPALKALVARAMMNLGITLGQSGQVEEGFAIYRGLVTRFSDSPEAAVQEQVARAMVNLGLALGQSGKVEEETATYRDLIRRFAQSSEPALQRQAARATVNLGITLCQSGQVEEGIATYRDLIARLAGSAERLVQEPVARAMANLGDALRQSAQPDEGVVTYRELITRFGNSPEPAVQGQVAHAMLNLAITLGQSGKVEEGIATHRDLIGRFGNSEDPAMQQYIAGAMVNLGVLFSKSSRTSEAAAVFREVIARFSVDNGPAVRELVAAAMLNLGATLGRPEGAAEAARLYRDAIARFDDRSPGAISSRLLYASVLNEIGRQKEARFTLIEAAHRLAEVRDAPLSLAEDVLKAILSTLPLTLSEQLVGEIQQSPVPSIAETAHLYRFVLDLLRADEPAPGRVKLGPEARRKRALGRVPPELRETVIEKAELIKQQRTKTTAPPEPQSLSAKSKPRPASRQQPSR